MDETRDFPIGLRNGLLAPKHRKALGIAIWEFMWLVEHVTEEYTTSKGELRGKVLGGSLITAERIAQDFSDPDPDEGISISPDTVRNHLATLAKAEYITCRRGTNGFHIEVRHSKKWPRRFSVPNTSPPSQSDMSTVGDSNCQPIGESENRRFDKNPESPNAQISDSPIASNDGTGTEDNAEDNNPTNIVGAAEIDRWWAAAVTRIAGNARYPEPIRRAFGACTYSLDGDSVNATLPADPKLRQVAERFWGSLGNHLRFVSGRPIRLTCSDYSARDGPPE